MKNKETEVLEKLVEIAKLRKEVFQLLLPEKTVKHLEVIGNEMKAMLLEALEGNTSSGTSSAESKPRESSVKKVDVE